MNGPVAQLVALTSHGNAVIAGHLPYDFFPANSTCNFCEYVKFAALVKPMFGKIKEQEVAATPQEWLAMLKTKAQALCLASEALKPLGIGGELCAVKSLRANWMHYTTASGGACGICSILRMRFTLTLQ